MTRAILRLLATTAVAAAITAAQDNSLIPPDIQANADRIRGEMRLPEAPPAAQPAAKPAQPIQVVTPEEQQADDEDNAILLRTMRTVNVDDLVISAAQQDAAEQDVKDMLGAAERMADRIDQRIARVNDLVAQGAVSQDAATQMREEAGRRHNTLELVTERAAMLSEVIEMARLDEAGPGGARRLASGAMRYDGSGRLIRPAEMATLSADFQKKFSHPLPVSAWGESAAHEMMGFDHRGRIDVAVYPDGPEGRWIRAWLERLRIPYYAFRTALPGRSTGAHIHIGPGSSRIQALSRGRARRRPAAD